MQVQWHKLTGKVRNPFIGRALQFQTDPFSESITGDGRCAARGVVETPTWLHRKNKV
jgi:hypothetical protein